MRCALAVLSLQCMTAQEGVSTRLRLGKGLAG
jgi:hypothetical protein